jgi:hypothetical protein
MLDESYFFAGAMYRGEMPSKSDFSSNENIDFKLFCFKKTKLMLTEMKLEMIGGPQDQIRKEMVKFSVKVTRNYHILYEDKIDTLNLLRYEYRAHEFKQIDDDQYLNIVIVVN